LTHLLEDDVCEVGAFWQSQQILSDDVNIAPVLDILDINESVCVVAVFQVDELQLFPAFVLLKFKAFFNV